MCFVLHFFVNVSFFRTEPELHKLQHSPVPIFRVSNTPVSEFLISDLSRQIVLGFLSKYEKGKTVTK